ncbi:outer membrane protein assembly factor BamB family protein [Actinomadura craniellae]|uniref:outer membrane protein assembly factor BamB family protein n=1 Tax=Actinomadura craniellae TaxID=2231787 RepID=UPI001F15792E|nr:PQQ-binding-like beta-propeller repeat protein [Actinomadura craniellae]
MLPAGGCTWSRRGVAVAGTGSWTDTEVNAVSRPAVGGGVTAVTGLRADGTLETAVFDPATGRRLWARPAALAGRPAAMGVQPPAVAGPAGRAVVVAVEPRRSARWPAALVARDARDGTQRWARPVGSTHGPTRCGGYVCAAESTARPDARFVVLDPATGRAVWWARGVAEMPWAEGRRAVLFRPGGRPVLEGRDLATGRRLWSFPVERAVGRGVRASDGWTFGALPGQGGGSPVLVGHVAPVWERPGRPAPPFGFFAVRVLDGRPLWARPRLLRAHPGAAVSVAPIGREVAADGGYGGFVRLDPRTGRVLGRVPADRAPSGAWWLALPDDPSRLGFLVREAPGTAYGAAGATPVPARGLRVWSFCTVEAAELPIRGQRGFFPPIPLCAYDLGTGRRVTAPGPPPAWFTGAAGGRRVWRDEGGALHTVTDGTGDLPGTHGN